MENFDPVHYDTALSDNKLINKKTILSFFLNETWHDPVVL